MDLLSNGHRLFVLMVSLKCHRAAPAMLRFAGVAPSDQLISFF